MATTIEAAERNGVIYVRQGVQRYAPSSVAMTVAIYQAGAHACPNCPNGTLPLEMEPPQEIEE